MTVSGTRQTLPMLGTWYEVARSGLFNEPKSNHVLVLHQHNTGSVSWLESWQDGQSRTHQREHKAMLGDSTICVRVSPLWTTRYRVVDYCPSAYLILAGTLSTRLYSSTPAMDQETWHAVYSSMYLRGHNPLSLVWSPCSVDGGNDVLEPRDASLHPRQCRVEWMD